MILGCEGLADCHCGLQSLEVPVSSGKQWQHCGCQIVTNSCEKLGLLKTKEWCQLGPLLSETTGTLSLDLPSLSPDKEEVSSDSKDLWADSQEIILCPVLPYSPCKDLAELEYYKAQKKPVKILNECLSGAKNSAEPLSDGVALLYQTSYRMVSHDLSCPQVPPKSEADVFVEIPLEKSIYEDGLDASQVVAAEVNNMLETVPSLEILKPSVKDGLVEHALVTGGKEINEVLDEQESQEQLQAPSQGELSSVTVEESDTKMATNLGTHGLRSLMDTDTIQKFKRRRLTTPIDVALVRDVLGMSERKSPVYLVLESNGQSNGQSEQRRGNCPDGSCMLRDSDEEVMLCKSSMQRDSLDDVDVKDYTASGDCNSGRSSDETIKGKDDLYVHSDSSSAGQSPVLSAGKEILGQYISSPPQSVEGSVEVHGPKKREWLAQHHGDNVQTVTTHNAGFAGCVGGLYRNAIDDRPAAPHPGAVGDRVSVQFCKVCGEREDANNSLICDSCDQVFHMTCVNSRMKIVPRVDDWYCRPCKKKQKMSRECNSQGDSEPGGEGKGWWREDAGIGKVERELMKMSNGRRMKVRIGPKYQAVVVDWAGIVEEVDLDDTLAEPAHSFGQEVVVTAEEKQREQEQAEHNLAHNIWPKGWLPATQLPPDSKENWLQCMVVLFEEGEVCPSGQKAEKDIVCGKWRRAPLDAVQNELWECSCALMWDPRHADCAVPQELSNEEISERLASKALVQDQPPV